MLNLDNFINVHNTNIYFEIYNMNISLLLFSSKLFNIDSGLIQLYSQFNILINIKKL